MLGLLICPSIFFNICRPHLSSTVIQKICFHKIQLKHLSTSGGFFFAQYEQLQRDAPSVCSVLADRHLAGGKTENTRKGVTESLRDETLAQAVLLRWWRGTKTLCSFFFMCFPQLALHSSRSKHGLWSLPGHLPWNSQTGFQFAGVDVSNHPSLAAFCSQEAAKLAREDGCVPRPWSAQTLPLKACGDDPWAVGNTWDFAEHSPPALSLLLLKSPDGFNCGYGSAREWVHPNFMATELLSWVSPDVATARSCEPAPQRAPHLHAQRQNRGQLTPPFIWCFEHLT